MLDNGPVQFQPDDRVVYARLTCEELNFRNVGVITDRIMEEMSKSAGSSVALDMSQVKALPSSAIGALLKLREAIEEKGRKLMLIKLHEQLRTTLEITKLDTLMKIYDSLEQALEAQASPLKTPPA